MMYASNAGATACVGIAARLGIAVGRDSAKAGKRIKRKPLIERIAPAWTWSSSPKRS